MQETDNDASDFADFVYSSLRFSEAASNNLARATKGNAWQVNQDSAPAGHFIDSPFVYTINELSVRTAKAMTRYARAYAWFMGKVKIESADLKTIMPYLLWHKVHPTQKALTENQRWANDRIDFVKKLVEKIEEEYIQCVGSGAFRNYQAALKVLRTGKIKDRELTPEEVRKVCKSAITEIGKLDKPCAITMANHVATEYNTRTNDGQYEQRK